MSKFTNQEVYTIPAAAERTKVDVRTINRWIRDGMPCRNVAGRIFIDHDDLMVKLKVQIKSRSIKMKRKEPPQEYPKEPPREYPPMS